MTAPAANAEMLAPIGGQHDWDRISLVARAERESQTRHRAVTDEELAAFDLPAVAYVDNIFDIGRDAPRVLAIRRGEHGYHPVDTDRSAEELNRADNVTEAQVLAMLTGSLIGWDVPGARPWTWAETASTGLDRRARRPNPHEDSSSPSAVTELQP